MHKGSCLCGAVSYELKSDPKAVTHCHCAMCQKQHGAAFATYGSVPRADLTYLAGEELLARYNSSASITRTFCSRCGSSIEWTGSDQFADWVSITLATLDTPFRPKSVKTVHLESRACWLDGSDP
ncbi:GFA family protein [Stutzerimonas stutzeri]|uniref:GFA family protein n=1 Tax=Stutzerimonas stutzeri TaxID=316 RepID=UPI0021092280|nr:GFA family protein [Stutzerimonas stutzeri]MCQ4260178.1 GFA family protein [Stutzerimonas stutzeri]